MISKVIMTRLAQNQLSLYIGYIKRKFKNPQAAKAATQDARICWEYENGARRMLALRCCCVRGFDVYPA